LPPPRPVPVAPPAPSPPFAVTEPGLPPAPLTAILDLLVWRLEPVAAGQVAAPEPIRSAAASAVASRDHLSRVDMMDHMAGAFDHHQTAVVHLLMQPERLQAVAHDPVTVSGHDRHRRLQVAIA